MDMGKGEGAPDKINKLEIRREGAHSSNESRGCDLLAVQLIYASGYGSILKMLNRGDIRRNGVGMSNRAI